jgi:hypothetical protein
VHHSSFARPRRRLLAAATGTALLLSLAPLGAAAADAAPLAATSVATTTPPAPHVAKTPRHLKGVKGHLTYDVTIPVFSGTKAAAAINHRVLTSARDTIAAAAKEEPVGDVAHHELDGVGHVTTNDGRTVQVVLEYDDYYDGAAHPTDSVDTVALVARTAAPITLPTVFRDEHTAYTVLAREVKRIAAKQHEPITEPSGLAPKRKNWAAWQTTKKGFQVHFQDYQVGPHGLPVYTVPWKAVRPLLTAKAVALLAPRP